MSVSEKVRQKVRFSNRGLRIERISKGLPFHLVKINKKETISLAGENFPADFFEEGFFVQRRGFLN